MGEVFVHCVWSVLVCTCIYSVHCMLIIDIHIHVYVIV